MLEIVAQREVVICSADSEQSDDYSPALEVQLIFDNNA